MINLLRFIIKYSALLLFVLFELVSVVLLLRYNQHQQGQFFNLTSDLTLAFEERYRGVTDYLRLRSMNEELSVENNHLLNEVERLRHQLHEPRNQSTVYRSARVLSNQVAGRYNRILLDQGSIDGLDIGMGVLSNEGHPVGIIEDVTDRYSAALSLLNLNYSLSVSVKGTAYFGLLRWNPPDVWSAIVEGLPAHAAVAVGDSIVTSGYSQVFRPDLPVGVVTRILQPKGQGRLLIDVMLHVDMADLNFVSIADVPDRHRLDSLLAND